MNCRHSRVVTLSLSKGLCLSAFLFVIAAGRAQEFNNIEYLCADWGPAMTLPAKEGEKSTYDESREEIYFLKQVTGFVRKKLGKRDILSGRDYVDEGKGVSIWLCKMKPDGSGKAEIKELWRSVTYPIDTQGQSCWLDVNEKTRRIALAIAFAGGDLTGLWTLNLDGGELKRLITPEWKPEYLQTINHCSWTPDGEWIVFEEELRGMNPNRFNIAKCDATGQRFSRIMESKEKAQYRQPSVSPNGEMVAFSKYPNGYPGNRYVWLANVNGASPRPLVPLRSDRFEEKSKGWGDWPAWSPDGKRIFFLGVSSTIADVETGEELVIGALHQAGIGWPQWGKHGLITLRVCGIAFGDLTTKTSRVLAACTAAECKNGNAVECRW